MENDTPIVLVFAGKIQEYHSFMRAYAAHRDAPPASFIYMSSPISMYGYKDCLYAIIGTWNGPRNDTMNYLEAHNIKPYNENSLPF